MGCQKDIPGPWRWYEITARLVLRLHERMNHASVIYINALRIILFQYHLQSSLLLHSAPLIYLCFHMYNNLQLLK